MEDGPFSEKMYKHIISAHISLTKLEKFKCEECEAEFFIEKDYLMHSIQHVEFETRNNDDSTNRFIKRYKCSECGAKFVEESTLEAHAEAHDPYPHVCYCGIGFYDSGDLRSHKGLVHSNEIKQKLSKLTHREQKALINECWLPVINYTGKLNINAPKSNNYTSKPNTNGKGPKLKATLTMKKVKRRKIGKNHKRDKTEKKEKTDNWGTYKRVNNWGTYNSKTPYHCDICGKKFTNPNNHELHMKAHAGIKDLSCRYCSKKFLHSGNLRQHERIHTGEKPHVCTYCTKAFSDPSALGRHVRTHTGVKPYSCSFCGMKFSDASGRIAHEKRHTNVKNKECDICGKKFLLTNQVSIHKRNVHSKELKYKCDICSKLFASKLYIREHIKRNHK